jgi:phytoene dehydrogenase-like protein
MIDRFFRPLAGMLFLDRSLTTSSRLFQLVLRMLAEGPVAVPALGMQAISDQLVAKLAKDSIRCGAHVDHLGHREVFVGNETIRARAIVIATGSNEAARLIGEEHPRPPYCASTLLHYAADAPPLAEPNLMLDGEGCGPVNDLLVVSNAASAYAPEGKSLIVAGVVGVPQEDDAGIDRRVRLQLAEWFGAAVSAWKLLRVRRDAEAMPDQTAGTLDPWQRPVRIRPGLYVCGAHRDNATIDGILTSGFRAAQAVMEDLHARIT